MPAPDLARIAAELSAEISPYEPFDLGIVWAVKVLRDAGVETFESCEGGPGHSYREPTVAFHGPPSEGFRAYAVAIQYRLPIYDLRRVWCVQDGELTGPRWEMTFRGPVTC